MKPCEICGKEEARYAYGRFNGIPLNHGWYLCPKCEKAVRKDPEIIQQLYKKEKKK